MGNDDDQNDENGTEKNPKLTQEEQQKKEDNLRLQRKVQLRNMIEKLSPADFHRAFIGPLAKYNSALAWARIRIIYDKMKFYNNNMTSNIFNNNDSKKKGKSISAGDLQVELQRLKEWYSQIEKVAKEEVEAKRGAEKDKSENGPDR